MKFFWEDRCGVTMGRPDYIFGQFRETARCRDAQHGYMGAGLVVLYHRSLLLVITSKIPSRCCGVGWAGLRSLLVFQRTNIQTRSTRGRVRAVTQPTAGETAAQEPYHFYSPGVAACPCYVFR